MRLTERLVSVASLLAATTAGCVKIGGDSCGGADQAPSSTVTITAEQACKIIEEGNGETLSADVSSGYGFSGPTCQQVCPANEQQCELPNSYLAQALQLNPDAGASPTDDAGLLALECPTSPAQVTITCYGQACTGRLTEGYRAPDGADRLANMAYLEAVSVHAFERLERELDAHGAPPSLRRQARRARRDEVRHTAMTARLARERGGSPRLPEAPSPSRARTLLELALENAVEGCVRETYGAVQGLVEAQTSRDDVMRRAMQSIAADECRHAELAWAVHDWAMPRLSAVERSAVQRAMKDAIAEIATRDPRTASLLFS
jgi:hypothetical protein